MQTWEITRRAPSQSWSIFLNANQHECVCDSCGHLRESVESASTVWEADPAGGSPLRVCLLSRHPQLGFPARWR